MRRFVIVLLVVVAVAVGADVALRLWSEAWVARRVDASLGLPSTPDVDLHGFPFFVQVIRSRFERVDVDLEGLETEGLRLDAVRLELREVRFPRDRLFSRGSGTIRARSGTVVAEVADDDLSASLRQQDIPVEVEFIGPEVRATATVEVLGQEISASARATLDVEDGSLVFRPASVEVAEDLEVPLDLLSFKVPLPQPVEGVTFERVAVEEGVARVEGDLHRPVFRVRG